MKKIVLATILCVLSWASSLAQTPAPPILPALIAPVLSVTPTDPATVQAFVKVADAFRISADARIRALEGELAAVNAVVEAGSQLTRHDQEIVEQQSAELTVLRGQLEEISRVIFRCWALLPAHYQKLASKGILLYDAIEQYEADLKRNGNRKALIGMTLGAIIVLLLPR